MKSVKFDTNFVTLEVIVWDKKKHTHTHIAIEIGSSYRKHNYASQGFPQNFNYSKIQIFPTIPTTAISISMVSNQTGSITAAIVDITNSVSVMLETNKYVRCLTIDFSKAFDSVDHLSHLFRVESIEYC